MKINEKYADEFPWGKEKAWLHRTKKICRFLPDDCSAVDIGGGFCHPTRFVKFRKYLSLDNRKWTDVTKVCNLDKGEFPDIGTFEFMICQGVIEYMHDPVAFLEGISKYASRMILTYRLGKNIKSVGFRNEYLFGELKKILKTAGYEIVVEQFVEEVKGKQNEKLFYCVNTKYGQKR